MISDEEDLKPRRIRNPAAKAQKAAALGLHGKVAEKVCGRCREMKPAAAYHQNRSKPTGLNSWCRACTNKWYKDRPVQKVTVKEKKCSGCQVVKPADAFHRQSRLPTGLRIYCKACEHEKYVKKHKLEAATVTEKQCTKCLIVKPAQQFHAQRNVSTGLHSWCKTCVAAEYARNPRHRKRAAAKARSAEEMDSGDGEGGDGDDEDGEETETRAYRRPAKRAAPHDAHGNGNGVSNGAGAAALYPDDGVSAIAQQRMLRQAAADLTEAMGAIRHGGDAHYEAPLPWPAAAAFHHAGGAAAAAHLQAAYDRHERQQLLQQAQAHLPMLDGAPGGVNFASPRFSEFGQYLSLAPSPQGSRQPGPAGSHAALNGHDDGGGGHQPQQALLPEALLEERYHPAAAARDAPRTAGSLPPGFANGGFGALASTPRRLAAVQQAADSLSVGGPYARMHSEAEAATHHASASGGVAGGGYALPRTPPPAFDVAAAQGAQVHPEHCWQPPWVSAGLPAQEQMLASSGAPKPAPVDYAATGSDAVDMELLEHLPQDAIPQYKNLIARAPATQHERGESITQPCVVCREPFVYYYDPENRNIGLCMKCIRSVLEMKKG